MHGKISVNEIYILEKNKTPLGQSIKIGNIKNTILRQILYYCIAAFTILKKKDKKHHKS